MSKTIVHTPEVILTLVIAFELTELAAAKDLIETARGFGRIVQATIPIPAETIIDLEKL